jgi:hypothetical protein
MTKPKLAGAVMTPDIAWATAATEVDGTAVAPRHWDDGEAKQEAFWARFTELLGNPPEEEMRGILADHREAIARIELMRFEHRHRGFATITFNEPESEAA